MPVEAHFKMLKLNPSSCPERIAHLWESEVMKISNNIPAGKHNVILKKSPVTYHAVKTAGDLDNL